MSDKKLREKADALIAFTQQGPRFIAWVQAVTDALAPAPEKAAKVCGNCGEKVSSLSDHVTCAETGDYYCQPAPPEPAKVECPNCGEMTEHNHSRYEGPGPDKWACQPAPPEPAAPEMPEAVYIAANTLRASGHVTLADALLKEAWHSQPVAHPFKAGFKPDSMRHFAEYVRDNWHYFGTDTAGLAHQFLQEMAAQPVAVGMTEELSMVLLRAEYGATEDERNPNLRDGYVARLKSAIETVRQQAAQVKL